MDEIDKDVERRVAALTPEDRLHLRRLVYTLIKCYDENAPDCAVVMFGTSEELGDVYTLGCDPMSAATLLSATNDLFTFINTKDAPPKEKFN